MTRGTLVFDGDCAFCTSSARLLMRLAPAVRIVPWQTTDLPALGLTEAQCSEAVQWVGPSGEHAAGETAIARVLQTSSVALRLAGLAILGTRPVSAWVYRWVAAHRQHMPGGTPACAVPKEPAA
jgi:predicted DCC family thiol-disulfide oxidoreductase YuxK